MRMWYALSLVIAIALPLTTGIRPAIAVVLYPWCLRQWRVVHPQPAVHAVSALATLRPAGAALTPLPARNRPSLWRVDVWAFLHRRGNCAGFGQLFV
jgi:hypothetical protein